MNSAILRSLTLFSMLISVQLNGQTSVVNGKVVTSDSQPVGEVTVTLVGVRQVITNKSGEYRIHNVAPGTYPIRVSAVGLVSQQKNIQVSGPITQVSDFVLKESLSELKEVTVRVARTKYAAPESDYVGKMPLRNLENAQVYTTVTQQLMNQQLVFTVDDAVKNAPGIAKIWDATNRAGAGGTWLVSRGFPTQPKARNGLAGNVTTAIDVANLEKIEVIKGPSATLFGNIVSSYGGLINRVTKKPFEKFAGEVNYAGGGYGLNRFSLDVNAPLDEEKKTLLRINAVQGRQNSFQDYGYNKNLSFAPSFSYKVNDALTLNFDAEVSHTENSGGSQVIYFLTPSYARSILSSALLAMKYPQTAVDQVMSTMPSTMEAAFGTNRADELKLDYKRSYQSNDLINKVDVANFFGEVKYKLSDRWTSQTQVAKGATSSDGTLPYFYLLPNLLPNFIGSVPSGAPDFGVAGHDNMVRMAWRPVGSENSLEIQQNFIGDFHLGKVRNRIAAGLDFYNYTSKITYNRFTGSVLGFPFADAFDVVKTSGTVPNYANFNKGKVDSAFARGARQTLYYNDNYSTYSAFVNDVLNITENFIVSLGLRADHFRNRGNYQPDSAKYIGGYNQTALAPKFGLIYQPVKDKISLFGNFQTGFTNVQGTNVTGEFFKPEQSRQFEGGVKLNLLGDVLSGSFSYYDIQVKDVVRPDVNNPGFEIQNGEQSSKGYEVEITAFPAKGLNVIFGYAHNDSKMTRASADVEGLRPVTAGPADALNLWAAYQFDRILKGVSIGFGGNYAGESYPVNSNLDGKFILPSYTLLNASLGYDHPRFRIGAKLNNIGNKHYWVGYTTVNPQMGRQLIGSVALKF